MSRKGLAATTSTGSCGHHADLRNIPTVQLGEQLSSLYISEQRIPARQGEPSGNNPNNVPVTRSNSGSSVIVESGGSDKEFEAAQRQAETSSTTSVDIGNSASSPGSQAASMTPSTPPTISSGKSYSNEMHDTLTPLREALPPAVSTKRRSITDSGGINRRNVNASSSYADLPTVSMSPRHPPANIAGLSEILASPSFSEMQAFRSPDYSPYERTGSGSRMLNTGHGDADRQVDYFNLPISHREGPSSSHGAGSHFPNYPNQSSPRADYHQQATGSLDPAAEGSTSTPSWSSSDVTSATQSSSLRSPKIRNEGMLAPHGSFTSAAGRQYQARARLERAQSRRDHDNESVKSGDSISSWRSRTASLRSNGGAGKELTEDEYLQNVELARGGDQLALYHLGWGPAQGPNRHDLGDADLIWGGAKEPTSPSSFSSRSSATSRPSVRSNSTSGSFPRHLSGKSDQERLRDALNREPKKEERPKLTTRTTTTSDLFADVARMTLRSNADNNRTTTPRAAASKPKPKTPSGAAPASPGRPSIFKSASYVSTSGQSTGSSRVKKDKERKGRDRNQDGIRERDPEREKRRAARHAARREEAASASGSNATTTTGKNRENPVSPIAIPAGGEIEAGGQETPRPVTRSRTPPN